MAGGGRTAEIWPAKGRPRERERDREERERVGEREGERVSCLGNPKAKYPKKETFQKYPSTSVDHNFSIRAPIYAYFMSTDSV